MRGAVHDHGIVREYVGHGIGTQMHMPPDDAQRRAGRWSAAVPGLVVAVEPMVTLGAPDNVTLPDGWTVVTHGRRAGRALGTHSCRHLDRPWVLTARDGGRAELAALG